MPKFPKPTDPDGPPSMEELEDWIFDVELPRATDGCTIEPDGICPHGHPSWMIRMGLI